MDANLHWSIWLISGIALGLLTGLGQSGLFGLLAGVAILASPVVIYMKVGVALMPFALFYGGLITVSSLLYRRRNAQQNAQRREEIEASRRRMK